MQDWIIIGVPSSAGAHYAGQERAPDALRAAGLPERLREAGQPVRDAGNLPGAVFTVDRDHPGGRNLPAVVRVAYETADAVAELTDSGPLPLVLGGDCTITLGVIAGFRRRHPDVGLVYVDGDADLSTPDSDDGIFDSMGIAHLLGRGAPELTGLAGPGPLIDPARLALIGADPRETDAAGRDFLAAQGVSFQEAPALIADPAGAAARALAAIEKAAGPVVVHLDVDVLDSGDLPLGNFPHYGSGVRLEHVTAALQVLRQHPSFAGLVLTEVNPTHDGDGTLLRRLVTGLVAGLDGG